MVMVDCLINVLLRDKVGKDDYIGTTYISLSEISVPGKNGKKIVYSLLQFVIVVIVVVIVAVFPLLLLLLL